MVSTLANSFQQITARSRPIIEDALAARTGPALDCPESLREAIRYSLLAPGKRLRPLLVLMAAEACGCQDEAALPAACAIEMIHCYSLIHDDLPAMDDDDLRRGRPTCHKKFDEATAILAGDALLTLAFGVIADEIKPPEVAAACCRRLAIAAGASGMVGGQAIDLEMQFSQGTIDDLKSVHLRKTGALILASLQLGTLVAGADESQTAGLEIYGRAVGLAFQITDDLLDIRGDEQTVGKRIGKDAKQGKLTFPGLLGEEESRRQAIVLIDKAVEALDAFEQRATPLVSLARYVLERDR